MKMYSYYCHVLYSSIVFYVYIFFNSCNAVKIHNFELVF